MRANTRAAIALSCAGSLLLSAASARASGPWFEEAPPTLLFYLHRLPAKTIQEIADETQPTTARESYNDYRGELRAIADRIGSAPPAELTAKIDKLLRDARTAQAEPAVANILHDARDLLSAAATSAPREAADYIRWRLEHAAAFGWIDEPPARGSEQDRPVASEALVMEIEKRLANAPSALRPHWLYLRGALLFRSAQDTESQKWFERILAQFPQHPRAEAALFMDARCQFSRARDSSYTARDPVLVEEHLPRAEQLFRQYLKQYPQGRFAGDAIGWLGALAFDQKDFTSALKFYIQQTEIADHPELHSSALAMCEKTLSHIASSPDDAAFAEVARHPCEATALLYLILNSTESDDFNGERDAVPAVKEWKKNVLPRLASAVAAQKAAYDAGTWSPRYLAILAQAASESGQQAQALELVAMAGAGVEQSDDLLFARAVASQRAGKLKEAIADLRALSTRFAKSPLARGARLRLGLALQDDHQAGEAILELKRLGEAIKSKTPEADEPEIYNEGELPADETDAEPAQIAQLIDTLLNFAPLPELEAALQRSELKPEQRLDLTRAIAQRYLAREDFANAKKFTVPAEWSRQAAVIEQLTVEVAQTQNKTERATNLLKLGDAWAAARKQLLNAPLDSAEARRAIYRGDDARAGLLRRENARALLPNAEIEEALDARDELRHATRRWLEAADAEPGSQTAATALWRALKAVPMIADVSAYSLARAQEMGAEATAKTLYDRLQRECPQSREATELAAYWSFPAVKPDSEAGGVRTYYEGSVYDGSFVSELMTAFQLPDAREGSEEHSWAPELAQIKALPDAAAKMDAPRFAETVSRLSGAIRQKFRSSGEAAVVNFADDLVLFAKRSGVSPNVRARYVKLRVACLRQSVYGEFNDLSPGEDEISPNGDAVLQNAIYAAQKDPACKPIADFLAFLDLAVVANHLIEVPVEGVDKDGGPFTYRSRDYKLLEQMTAQFLSTYPTSEKREAATLLHARAVFMLSRPVFYKNWQDWPAADRWDGAFPAVFHQREPLKPERVLGALNDYLRPYGSGQYFPEVRSYRADVAAQMQDWDRALDLTIAQMADTAHAELFPEAARRLGAIFAQLADEEKRAPLLRAIGTRPRIKEALSGYLAVEREDHPLLYLKRFVADRLDLKLPEPAAATGTR